MIFSSANKTKNSKTCRPCWTTHLSSRTKSASLKFKSLSSSGVNAIKLFPVRRSTTYKFIQSLPLFFCFSKLARPGIEPINILLPGGIWLASNHANYGTITKIEMLTNWGILFLIAGVLWYFLEFLVWRFKPLLRRVWCPALFVVETFLWLLVQWLVKLVLGRQYLRSIGFQNLLSEPGTSASRR